MIRQLRKVGKSQALLLEKPILDLLGISERGSVQLTVTNGSLIVTPVEPVQAKAEPFHESLDKVMTSRRALLRRLSQ